MCGSHYTFAQLSGPLMAEGRAPLMQSHYRPLRPFSGRVGSPLRISVWLDGLALPHSLAFSVV